MMGTQILVLPTRREDDGVAMSSRNVYLSADERRAAGAIPRGLEAARAAVAAGERDPSRILVAAREPIEAEPLLRVDYVALVGAEGLDPPTQHLSGADGEMLLAVAVFAGTTRLIDNVLLGSSVPVL